RQVVLRSFIGAEIEAPASVDSPSGLREGHVAVFDPGFQSVFASSPANIIQELVAVVDVAPAARPWRAISGVALRPAEVDRGKARFVKYRWVGHRRSQLLIPLDASRQLVPLHIPAVVWQRGLIKEVRGEALSSPAYDRWHMQGNQLAGGVGWNQKLGLGLPNQSVFNNAGFPQLNFNGPIGYTHYGTPWASGGSDINNRYQFLDDITWITGRHTLKAGVEFRYMTFPQTGWAVNTGGNFTFNAGETSGYDASGTNLSAQTGDAFASFILGQVDSANFSAPFSYMPKMKYSSPWINDDFKLTPKLTLTFGLRFDWQSGLSEQHGKFSTFDPTAQNPVGHLGATIFNSSKAIGNSSWSTGPRFGFAYQIKNKTVVRGGYGIYYAGAQADSWDPYPVDGYQTNPVAPNITNGQFPAFYFQGTGSCPSVYGPTKAAPCGWPTGSIVLPPQLKPDVSNGGNPVGVDPKTYTMPRYQNWSISF